MTINIRMAVAIVCMLCTSLLALAQQAGTSTDTLPTDAAGRPMLLGKQPREALLQAPFADWFRANYQAYLVDSFTCQFIRPLLADKHLSIFMGTWCGDSKREVPRLLKMQDCCGFPASQLTLIMVNNHASMYKQSPGHEEAGRNILRVPTLIVESNGKEVGRLIEYPVVSLEKDLLAILRQDGYVPHYSSSTGR